ncbi:MAG: AAA family ATPase [Flavobacteriaceae bacterium]|nr:AAA family ATPase [Flavobacteriaceae bacterium]
MSKHFIKEIEIKNFKCFDNFEAKGFGRVNLIGGKNNVGKTALMEAAYVNTYAQDIKRFTTVLYAIKYMRENLNILSNNLTADIKNFIEQSNGIFVQSNINKVSFEVNEQNGIKQYHFEFKNKKIDVNVNNFSFEINDIENIQFIDNFGLSNNEIINNYSAIQKREKEDYLNNLLHQFDSSIDALKIIDKSPQCRMDIDYLEITELGDGVRHLVSIVTSLYKCEHGYLFIDEVDNGIHYTMLDELWRVIFEVSSQLDVQVFATTHSKESIESFNRVQKERKDEDTYYFEMAKNIKTDKIFMSQIDSEQLKYDLRNKESIRGE